VRQKIDIKIATIEKNGDHAKTKLNLEVDLVTKCGLVEPFIKLIIKETKHWKFFRLSKNI
jgi:hypothetical protein